MQRKEVQLLYTVWLLVAWSFRQLLHQVDRWLLLQQPFQIEDLEPTNT